MAMFAACDARLHPRDDARRVEDVYDPHHDIRVARVLGVARVRSRVVRVEAPEEAELRRVVDLCEEGDVELDLRHVIRRRLQRNPPIRGRTARAASLARRERRLASTDAAYR